MMRNNGKSTFFVNFAMVIHLLNVKNMSKTNDLQVEKSNTLLKAFREHLSDLIDKGVNAEQLNEMERKLAELKVANETCDRIRDELSHQVKITNALLQDVKENYLEKKKSSKDTICKKSGQNMASSTNADLTNTTSLRLIYK